MVRAGNGWVGVQKGDRACMLRVNILYLLEHSECQHVFFSFVSCPDPHPRRIICLVLRHSAINIS